MTKGDANLYLHVIISGEAEVWVNGKKVATLLAPQEFGLLSLLNGVRCTATVRSGLNCPTICYLLDRHLYNKYFKEKSKVALAVANSERSMTTAVAFHEEDSDDEQHEEPLKAMNSY